MTPKWFISPSTLVKRERPMFGFRKVDPNSVGSSVTPQTGHQTSVAEQTSLPRNRSWLLNRSIGSLTLHIYAVGESSHKGIKLKNYGALIFMSHPSSDLVWPKRTCCPCPNSSVKGTSRDRFGWNWPHVSLYTLSLPPSPYPDLPWVVDVASTTFHE